MSCSVRFLLAFLTALLLPATALALTLTFEGGETGFLLSYEESGFLVTAVPSPRTGSPSPFVLTSGGADCFPPNCADNGTIHARSQTHTVIRIERVDSVPFSLFSVDIAETRGVDPRSGLPIAVPTLVVTGFKSDGSSVVSEFEFDEVIDGPGGLLDFETIPLPADFSDLTAVQFEGVRTQVPLNATSYRIDNVRLSEPCPEAFVCSWPTDSVSQWESMYPGGPESSDAGCEKACKAFVKSCKQVAAAAKACSLKVSGAYKTLNGGRCKLDSDPSGCKGDANRSFTEDKGWLRVNFAEAVETCEGLFDECFNSCLN